MDDTLTEQQPAIMEQLAAALSAELDKRLTPLVGAFRKQFGQHKDEVAVNIRFLDCQATAGIALANIANNSFDAVVEEAAARLERSVVRELLPSLGHREQVMLQYLKGELPGHVAVKHIHRARPHGQPLYYLPRGGVIELKSAPVAAGVVDWSYHEGSLFITDPY